MPTLLHIDFGHVHVCNKDVLISTNLEYKQDADDKRRERLGKLEQLSSENTSFTVGDYVKRGR